MFYTYVWLREDGTPYYVGKGSGNRAYSKDHRHGVPPLGRIIFYIAKDEVDAFETEVALIWYYGRKDLGTGCLRNLTNGGENPPSPKGRVWSKESRERLSESAKTRTYTEKEREKMSESAKIRQRAPLSADTRSRISDANKGKVMSADARLKMSLSRLGKAPWNKGLKVGDVNSGSFVKGHVSWKKGTGMSLEEKRASHNFRNKVYREKRNAQERPWQTF